MLQFLKSPHISVSGPLYKVKEPSTSMDLEEQYDKIYRYCLRRLGDRTLAEDVTQETFARYYAAGPRGASHETRWLYAVARNLCTDEYRRAKPEPLPDDVPAPEGTMAEDAALRAALASLAGEEQELLLMRYVNREPVGLIAAHLGMSRFAVYRRTAAALDKLRRALEEDEA